MKLARLKEAGLLTEEEFTTKKRSILGLDQPATPPAQSATGSAPSRVSSKKCSCCGKEHTGEATVCPADGQPLICGGEASGDAAEINHLWDLTREDEGWTPQCEQEYAKKLEEWRTRNWPDWLAKKLVFPFHATIDDDDDDGEGSAVAEQLQVLELAGGDVGQGISVKVQQGDNLGYLSLADIEVEPRSDPNFWPVTEYGVWFHNRAEANSQTSDRSGTAKKTEEAIGMALVMIPVASALLTWFWIGNMRLMDGPSSKLALVSAATVFLTAVLVSIEAARLGFGSDPNRPRSERDSPTVWFFGMVFVWLIAYPRYLYLRSRYGARNLIGAGLVSMLLWFLALGLVGYALVTAEDNLQRQLQSFQHSDLQTSSSSASKLISKAEWRSKVRPYYNPGGGISVTTIANFKALVGEPSRTETLEGTAYWYYDCSDGTIQVELVNPNMPGVGGRMLINAINDY